MTNFTSLGRWQWVEYEEIESTNDEALRLNTDFKEPCNIIVTAHHQTKGRGRRGRDWVSLDGNLFMSQVLCWDYSNIGALVLISGLAILHTVKQLSSTADVKLKWPNDVLLENKKVSGILLEITPDGNVIVGIGVNISKAPQNHKIIYAATSLRDNGIACERISFMRQYLEHFDNLCSSYNQQGISFISNLWLKFAAGLNEKITVNNFNKEQKGIFRGINQKGMLLLEQEDGTIVTVGAGDVFFDDNGENNK